MAVTVKKVERPAPDLYERTYLPEVLRGMAVTTRHFFKNLVGRGERPTVRYPEEVRPYSDRWRGMHRLVPRPDGTPRCVACMLCATSCPAKCIHIEAGERDRPEPLTDDQGKAMHGGIPVEKYPVSFVIDELRCVVCGLCVEACPCDAIRMDTGTHHAASYTREDQILGKVDLLSMLGKGSKPGETPEVRAKTPPPDAPPTHVHGA